MNLLELLKHSKPLFYGLGKENQALIAYLIKTKVITEVDYYDDKWIRVAGLNLNRVSRENFKNYDLIIKSPGVSPYLTEFKEAISSKAKIFSPNQIFFDLNQSYKVCVTGSKGKSTAVKLITEILNAINISAYSAGNIGKPLVEYIDHSGQVAVIELSSFQLQSLKFKARRGLITSLFPEHLIWHLSEQCYYRDKLKIAEACQSVLLLDLADLDICKEHSSAKNYQLIHLEFDDQGVRLTDNLMITYGESCFKLPHLRAALVGCLEIISAVAQDFSIDLLEHQDKIQQVVHQFKNLPHRLEVVYQKDSQVVVDDSIATVPEAAIAAMEAFSEYPLAVFLGGQGKGVSPSKLLEYLKNKLPARLICVGETGQEIYEEYGSLDNVEYYSNLKLALESEIDLLADDYSFLLAPGATSFGEFNNYAERGDFFQNFCLDYLK